MRTILALACLCAVAVADDAKELKTLNGTWKVEKAEIDGADQTDAFKVAVMVLDNGTYDVSFGDMKDKGTLSVDATKTPKTMDVKGTDGTNKGKSYPCIYELKDDKLTICYGLDEKTRPAKFESAKESNTMLVVYKREKK